MSIHPLPRYTSSLRGRREEEKRESVLTAASEIDRQFGPSFKYQENHMYLVKGLFECYKSQTVLSLLIFIKNVLRVVALFFFFFFALLLS